MSNELTIIPQEFTTAIARISDGIADSATIAAKFAPHYVAFHDAAAEALAIKEDQPAAARAMRLRLKAIRVASEKTRKETKEDALRRGKAIDGYHAILEDALVPVEKALDDIEKAEARRDSERKAKLVDDRRAQLAPYCDPQAYAAVLGDLTEGQFIDLLAGQKAAKEAADARAAAAEAKRIAGAKAAEDARIAKEAADAAERVRLAEEARLAREAQAAAEAKAAQERAEQSERDRLAKIEADRVAAEHAAELAEQERKRAEAEAAAKAERDRLQAEADKAAAEAARLAKIEADRVAAAEAQAAAEAEARKRAERAPDKEKLLAFAAALAAVPVPQMTTNATVALIAKIAPEVAALCDRIRAAAEKL